MSARTSTGTPLLAAKRTPWQIQRTVVFALLMREIKTRFGSHWSGVVWLIGLPLVQLALLLGVNVLMRGTLSRGSFDYAVFLVSAYVPYHLCTGLWTILPSGIGANRGLFNYRQVRPFDTLVARVILEFTIDLFVFLLLVACLDWIGLGVSVLPADPLAYLVAVGAFVLLGTGVGLVLASVIGILPRLTTAVQLLAFPLYFASGVLMSVHALPRSTLDYLLYNPLLHLVELARAAYLPGYTPIQGVNWWYPVSVTLVLWTLGMSLYRVRRRKIAAGN